MSSVVPRLKAVVVAVLFVSLLITVASPTRTSATASEAIAGSFAAAAQKTFGTGNTHRCVIVVDRSIECWGSNQQGQLGRGGAADTPASALAKDPLPVTGLSGKTFSQISTGNSVTCAVESTNGEVWCWGYNNEQGIVGGGSAGATYVTTPVKVKTGASTFLTNVKEVDVDIQHACALTNSGEVWCWGENNGGRLGTGSSTPSVSGTALKIVSSDAAALSVGNDSACIITTGGAVKCWGHNSYGQIGNNGGQSFDYTPSQVTGLTEGVRAISVGQSNACALLPNNVVKCWGQNLFGAIGDGTFGSGNDRKTPVEVLNPPADIVTISMNYDRAVVLTTTGKLFYWGGSNERYIPPTEWNPVTGGTYFALSASRTSTFESCYLVKLNNDLSVRCPSEIPNVNMSITTAPAAPTITVEPGDSQATITVTPGNGGGPVDSFVVTAQPGGTSCTVTPPATSCTINGLTNGTNYSFDAVAKNPAGDSASSASVDSTPTSSDGGTPGGDATGGNTSGGGTTGGGTTNNNTLSPGQYNATVNGQRVDLDITSSTNGQVTIVGPDFSLTFDSPTSGGNNELFLPQGGTVSFNGDGYMPNSNVTSTLTTTNTKLGENKAGRNGSFTSKLSVPRSTRTGNHQLSINGMTAKGSARSIVIGVKVSKLKKTTVKTFRVYSTKMRPKLRRQANRIVKQNPTLTAVHCEGFVRPSKATNPKDIARATKRAKSVCKYLKKRKKSIHTTISVSPSNLNRRRVEVSYR